MRILVVDDDPSVRDLVSLQLELEGHEVATAVDGVAALELIESAPVPDLLVLDVMMPRLNGWDVLERLRADERHRRLPVVLVTAKDLPNDRQRGRELGATALLAKPHDAQCLIDIVAAVSAVAASGTRQG